MPPFTVERLSPLSTRAVSTPTTGWSCSKGWGVDVPRRSRHATVVTWSPRHCRQSSRAGRRPRPGGAHHGTALGARARCRRRPGARADYLAGHPTAALLVVEVADSSLGQDRLTKASIYAASGVPEYWIGTCARTGSRFIALRTRRPAATASHSRLAGASVGAGSATRRSAAHRRRPPSADAPGSDDRAHEPENPLRADRSR